MKTANITIVNKLGLHARAAAKLVTLALTFKSTIEISFDGRTVNAKSIMGVMMLAAARGSEITLISNGDDESEALEAISKLIGKRFGEGK